MGLRTEPPHEHGPLRGTGLTAERRRTTVSHMAPSSAERKFTFDSGFEKSKLRLQSHEQDAVDEAIEQFEQDSGYPSLRFEKLQGRAGKNGYSSIRAGKGLRVLLVTKGAATAFIRAGHHDPIYEFAERTRFLVPANPAEGPQVVPLRRRVVDLDGEPIRRHGLAQTLEDSSTSYSRGILEHWATPELEAALKDFNLSREQINVLQSIPAASLLDEWPELEDSEELFDQVIHLAEITPEEWSQQQLLESGQEDERFRTAIEERGALSGLSIVLSCDELKRLQADKIEDWMIFLHPDQREFVDRRFNGPARVRGSAGTGKTVVALHRAASLAKRLNDVPPAERKPVLLTTFVRTLPSHLKTLYRRLPTAVSAQVDPEFVHIQELARRVCKEAGLDLIVDDDGVEDAFYRAHQEVVAKRQGSPLQRAGLTPGYLQDEVRRVIKGRGIDTLAAYLGIERTGRQTRFHEKMREQAWELRENWDQRLAEKGIVDYCDVVRQALDIACGHAEPWFSHVIVDEAQDLTLIELQLLRTLVNGPGGQDVPDGLLLVGDGAQKIYPGGFNLSQAGIHVGGRSTILRVNYRNTRQIIRTAMACTGSEVVDDMGEEYVRGEAVAFAQRTGIPPQLVKTPDFSAQIEYVANRVSNLVKEEVLSRGDVGICTHRRIENVKYSLEKAGLPTQNLKMFTGRWEGDVAKLGTFKRVKGFEFKIVFLLDISNGSFPTPRGQDQSDEEHAEQRTVEISQLHVAMTRARDALCVLCSGEPSDVIKDALEHFEVVEA